MLAPISSEKMALYRSTAQRRQRERQREIDARYARAKAAASATARMLRSEFGARKVALFGSLVHPELFHERSDIDLAVWGIDEREYLRAVARALNVDSEFSVDLVRMEEARESLRRVIEQESETLL